MDQERIYPVSEVNFYVKHLLEQDRLLRQIQVKGEVSNLTYHRSGHVYFSLKDGQAQLSCVMFRSAAQRADKMREGEVWVAEGGINVYVPRGSYQLNVQKIRKQGKGDLYQQFLELKDRLEKEGLFDPKRKKSFPPLPQKIVLITSPTGAAVKDVIQTLKRRYNMGQLILVPATVQGEKAAPSIVGALKKADALEADVILLVRGGGSIEDLWSFNDEAVARAIFKLQTPVITGVGHETDFTIADFVADLRASTPTAAAEKAVPEKLAIYQLLDRYQERANQSLRNFINFKHQLLDDYSQQLERATLQYLKNQQQELTLLEVKLEGNDVQSALKRGFSLTLKQGKVQHGKEEIQTGDILETIFHDGKLKSEVTEKED
ncbi:MAG: exodeoxyribonuclease VII large subunit [Bacteroidota bacterium]